MTGDSERDPFGEQTKLKHDAIYLRDIPQYFGHVLMILKLVFIGFLLFHNGRQVFQVL